MHALHPCRILCQGNGSPNPLSMRWLPPPLDAGPLARRPTGRPPALGGSWPSSRTKGGGRCRGNGAGDRALAPMYAGALEAVVSAGSEPPSPTEAERPRGMRVLRSEVPVTHPIEPINLRPLRPVHVRGGGAGICDPKPISVCITPTPPRFCFPTRYPAPQFTQVLIYYTYGI